MGYKRLSDIPEWHSNLTIDPDAASPVGSVKARDAMSLTGFYISKNMTVEYGEEQDGFVLWRARPLEIRTEELPVGDARTLVTMELSTTRTEMNRRTAVFAYYPYHLDWFGFSPFKRVQKRGRAAVDMAIARILQEAKESSTDPKYAIWATIMSTSTDVFGGEDRLYARFLDLTETQRSELLRTDQLAILEHRSYPEDPLPSLHEFAKANREPQQEPYIYMGVCGRETSDASFKDCRDLVRNSDPIIEVMESVRNGELLIDRDKMRIRPTAQQLGSAILEASIVKALAGPTAKHRQYMESESGKAFVSRYGGVVLVAKSIFEDQLLNLNKRLARGPNPEEPIFIEPLEDRHQKELGTPATVVAAGAHEKELSKSTLISRVKAAVRSLIEKKVVDYQEVWLRIQEMLQAKDFESVEEGCIYAAAAAQVSPMPMPQLVTEVLWMLRREAGAIQSAVQLALNSTDLSEETSSGLAASGQYGDQDSTRPRNPR